MSSVRAQRYRNSYRAGRWWKRSTVKKIERVHIWSSPRYENVLEGLFLLGALLHLRCEYNYKYEQQAFGTPSFSDWNLFSFFFVFKLAWTDSKERWVKISRLSTGKKIWNLFKSDASCLDIHASWLLVVKQFDNCLIQTLTLTERGMIFFISNNANSFESRTILTAITLSRMRKIWPDHIARKNKLLRYRI